MKNRCFIFLITCSLFAIGCLSRTSEKTAVDATPVEATTPPTIADLHLSLAKPVYSRDEPISVKMAIQVGKFDLLVPYATVEGRGAFTKLVVKDAMGKVVKPKHPITFVSRTKTLMQGVREVRCVQGTELKARMVKNAVLEDLQTYYKLKPGDYTLQVFIDMKVHRETFVSQSPEILEIEHEITLVERNPDDVPDDIKQRMINNLRKEIDTIKGKEEGKSDEIYLPLDSFRGSKDLESNIVALTIQ